MYKKVHPNINPEAAYPLFFFNGSSKHLLYQFFKTVQSYVFREQMHIYKYIQLRTIFRQHVSVKLYTSYQLNALIPLFT